jgi:serine/threonine-protein kinase
LQISSAGGQFPVWSHDARELLYRAADGRIMVAEYSIKGQTFYPEKPRPWPNLQIPVSVTGLGVPNFDLAPDGKRLVVSMPQPMENTKDSVHVTFLMNYFDELRRRLPVK